MKYFTRRIRFAALIVVFCLMFDLSGCAAGRTAEIPSASPVRSTTAEPETVPQTTQTEDTAQSSWHLDESQLTDDYLLSLVNPLEFGMAYNGWFVFNDPDELTESKLYILFLLLTDYSELDQCYNKTDQLFYFTSDRITRSLKPYFKHFNFDITKDDHYDAAADAIVTVNASGFGAGYPMKVINKQVHGNTVTFAANFYEDYEMTGNSYKAIGKPFQTKIYTIEFYDGGYYYISAVLTPVPLSEDGTATDTNHAPYAVTLWKDRTQALVDGKAVQLPAAPFVQHNTFYFPLKAVTELRGGRYTYQDDVATVDFYGSVTQYHINSNFITFDGLDHLADSCKEPLYADSAKERSELDIPIMKDGVVYLPVGYQSIESLEPLNWLMPVTQYPQSDMVIFGGWRKEEGVNGFCIRDIYDNLPEDLRSTMHSNGIVAQTWGSYDVEEYENDGLLVHVARVQNGKDDSESIDGMICDICLVGATDSTPRGLRCGDPAEQAWALYGNDFAGSLTYTLKDEKIDTIMFYTRYTPFEHNKITQ